MEYMILLVFVLYFLLYLFGSVITNKLGLSKKIYLNSSFTRLKSKYYGYFIIIITLLLLLFDYKSLNGVEMYYTMISDVSLIFFGIIMILRNDFLNLKFSSSDDNEKYYLDFSKMGFIPLIIIAFLTGLLRINSNILSILTMIVIVIELIVVIFAMCPDKIHEYFIAKKYSFDYRIYVMIIVVLSLLPVLILAVLIMIFSYIL